jgi:hypothetical protein
MSENETIVCPSCGVRIPLVSGRTQTEASTAGDFEHVDEDQGNPEHVVTAEPFHVEPLSGTDSSFDLAVRSPIDPVLIELGSKQGSHGGTEPDSEHDRLMRRGGSDISLATLHLQVDDKASRSMGGREVPPSRRTSTIVSEQTDDEYEYEPDRSRLPMILLASYASALTLALLWFVVLPKMRHSGDSADETAVASAGSDLGSRAHRSREIEPVPPIPEDHRTTLGHALRVGAVEMTALGVTREPLVLIRTQLGGGEVRKEEPKRCLVLRLRLRNTSDSLVFAPFDESFVRENDRGTCDSFVELGPKTRVYPYPLATQSEWSIEGQSFRELRPGETLETMLVGAPDGGQPEGDSLLWHIRIRSGKDKTEFVGVTTNVPEP